MNYTNVPNIISGKDLDYLSDMFNWNYGAYKSTINAVDEIMDEEIKSMLTKASDVFYRNMNNVIDILNSGVNNE